MPRFFVGQDAVCDQTVTITGADAHHIARSLRMAEGDEITVADGLGKEYLCRLSKIRDDECLATVLESGNAKTESPVKITLFMAYPKGDKMETVVQKAVELGACRIIPFESARCIKRPSEDKMDKLIARLNRIAEEAAKQCGRGIIPSVERITDVKGVIREGKELDLLLFCYEGEGTSSLKSVLGSTEAQSSRTLGVIIGSEGGFSAEEAALLVSEGAVAVNLGPRILRCETAPEYALSSISYHFEL